MMKYSEAIGLGTNAIVSVVPDIFDGEFIGGQPKIFPDEKGNEDDTNIKATVHKELGDTDAFDFGFVENDGRRRQKVSASHFFIQYCYMNSIRSVYILIWNIKVLTLLRFLT